MSKQTGRHKFNPETRNCERCGMSEEQYERVRRPCPGESSRNTILGMPKSYPY
jgi:hypothetical protein